MSTTCRKRKRNGSDEEVKLSKDSIAALEHAASWLPVHPTVTVAGKEAKLLGGHSAIALCVKCRCPECQSSDGDSSYFYLVDFCSHAKGVEVSEEETQEFRDQGEIRVMDPGLDTGAQMALKEWGRRQLEQACSSSSQDCSPGQHPLKGQGVWVYWWDEVPVTRSSKASGRGRWFHATVKSVNRRSGLLTVEYDDGKRHEIMLGCNYLHWGQAAPAPGTQPTLLPSLSPDAASQPEAGPGLSPAQQTGPGPSTASPRPKRARNGLAAEPSVATAAPPSVRRRSTAAAATPGGGASTKQDAEADVPRRRSSSGGGASSVSGLRQLISKWPIFISSVILDAHCPSEASSNPFTNFSVQLRREVEGVVEPHVHTAEVRCAVTKRREFRLYGCDGLKEGVMGSYVVGWRLHEGRPLMIVSKHIGQQPEEGEKAEKQQQQQQQDMDVDMGKEAASTAGESKAEVEQQPVADGQPGPQGASDKPSQPAQAPQQTISTGPIFIPWAFLRDNFPAQMDVWPFQPFAVTLRRQVDGKLEEAEHQGEVAYVLQTEQYQLQAEVGLTRGVKGKVICGWRKEGDCVLVEISSGGALAAPAAAKRQATPRAAPQAAGAAAEAKQPPAKPSSKPLSKSAPASPKTEGKPKPQKAGEAPSTAPPAAPPAAQDTPNMVSSGQVVLSSWLNLPKRFVQQQLSQHLTQKALKPFPLHMQCMVSGELQPEAHTVQAVLHPGQGQFRLKLDAELTDRLRGKRVLGWSTSGSTVILEVNAGATAGTAPKTAAPKPVAKKAEEASTSARASKGEAATSSKPAREAAAVPTRGLASRLGASKAGGGTQRLAATAAVAAATARARLRAREPSGQDSKPAPATPQPPTTTSSKPSASGPSMASAPTSPTACKLHEKHSIMIPRTFLQQHMAAQLPTEQGDKFTLPLQREINGVREKKVFSLDVRAISLGRYSIMQPASQPSIKEGVLGKFIRGWRWQGKGKPVIMVISDQPSGQITAVPASEAQEAEPPSSARPASTPPKPTSAPIKPTSAPAKSTSVPAKPTSAPVKPKAAARPAAAEASISQEGEDGSLTVTCHSKISGNNNLPIKREIIQRVTQGSGTGVGPWEIQVQREVGGALEPEVFTVEVRQAGPESGRELRVYKTGPMFKQGVVGKAVTGWRWQGRGLPVVMIVGNGDTGTTPAPAIKSEGGEDKPASPAPTKSTVSKAKAASAGRTATTATAPATATTTAPATTTTATDTPGKRRRTRQTANAVDVEMEDVGQGVEAADAAPAQAAPAEGTAETNAADEEMQVASSGRDGAVGGEAGASAAVPTTTATASQLNDGKGQQAPAVESAGAAADGPPSAQKKQEAMGSSRGLGAQIGQNNLIAIQRDFLHQCFPQQCAAQNFEPLTLQVQREVDGVLEEQVFDAEVRRYGPSYRLAKTNLKTGVEGMYIAAWRWRGQGRPVVMVVVRDAASRAALVGKAGRGLKRPASKPAAADTSAMDGEAQAKARVPPRPEGSEGRAMGKLLTSTNTINLSRSIALRHYEAQATAEPFTPFQITLRREVNGVYEPETYTATVQRYADKAFRLLKSMVKHGLVGKYAIGWRWDEQAQLPILRVVDTVPGGLPSARAGARDPAHAGPSSSSANIASEHIHGTGLGAPLRSPRVIQPPRCNGPAHLQHGHHATPTSPTSPSGRTPQINMTLSNILDINPKLLYERFPGQMACKPFQPFELKVNRMVGDEVEEQEYSVYIAFAPGLHKPVAVSEELKRSIAGMKLLKWVFRGYGKSLVVKLGDTDQGPAAALPPRAPGDAPPLPMQSALARVLMAVSGQRDASSEPNMTPALPTATQSVSEASATEGPSALAPLPAAGGVTSPGHAPGPRYEAAEECGSPPEPEQAVVDESPEHMQEHGSGLEGQAPDGVAREQLSSPSTAEQAAEAMVATIEQHSLLHSTGDSVPHGSAAVLPPPPLPPAPLAMEDQDMLPKVENLVVPEEQQQQPPEQQEQQETVPQPMEWSQPVTQEVPLGAAAAPPTNTCPLVPGHVDSLGGPGLSCIMGYTSEPDGDMPDAPAGPLEDGTAGSGYQRPCGR